MTRTLQTLTANVSGPLRHETMEDRPYTVVPMIMAVEGVLNGSSGSLFYSGEELGKIPAAWNHKPITINHPVTDGLAVSACDPGILDRQKVGIIMNARFEDSKLKAEAWVEESRLGIVDNRVADALQNNEMMELSTGLWSTIDETPGTWNQKSYDKTVRDIIPDHLAILPDTVGACSIKDGAGFFRTNKEGENSDGLNDRWRKLLLLENVQSHEEIRDALRDALNARSPTDDGFFWIERVYDSFIIHEDGDKLFKLSYQSTDDQVTFTGDPVEVVRVVEYRLKNGGTLVNNIQTETESDMKKEKIVDGLIANGCTHWSDEDREFLLSQNESQLEKMIPVVNVDDTPDPPTPDNVPDTLTENKESAITPDASPSPPKPLTAEEYVQNAPPEIREVLSSGLSVNRQQKAAFIESIVANEVNVFTKEYLETQSFKQLSGIARLAVDSAADQESVPMFLGQGPEVANVTNQSVGDIEPLVMPEVFPSK